MKKLIYIMFLALLPATVCKAQHKRYTVMFYNLENLFDTINDPTVNDEEFTPEGTRKWTGVKYWKKISNIEKVFYSVATENKSFPTVIGVSEIENRNVLEDIASQEKLLKANYQIVHYDGPDLRGVDVAFFYRPDQFKCEGSRPVKTFFPDRPNFKTRDILTMWGTIEGERFFFMVAHWPSRIGGTEASSPRRCRAAEIMRQLTDSVLNEHPDTKIIMMGDLNDDPTDKSIYEVLNAKGDINKLSDNQLFNPYYKLIKDGYGTLGYQDGWNLFDNIIVSQTLAKAPNGQIGLVKLKNGYYGKIFNRDFLTQKAGQYKNYPLRTYSGTNFQNGFSDHYPVFIYLEKQ